MKINSAGNLRGIIITTCDYYLCQDWKFSHSSSQPIWTSRFGWHVFRKNYTQKLTSNVFFQPKKSSPQSSPLFLWCGLTQRLKTWCEKLGVWTLWDGMSWNLITWFTPWKVNMEHKNHPTRKIIWTKPFISCVPAVNFQGSMDGIQWHYKFHTLSTICTKG